MARTGRRSSVAISDSTIFGRPHHGLTQPAEESNYERERRLLELQLQALGDELSATSPKPSPRSTTSQTPPRTPVSRFDGPRVPSAQLGKLGALRAVNNNRSASSASLPPSPARRMSVASHGFHAVNEGEELRKIAAEREQFNKLASEDANKELKEAVRSKRLELEAIKVAHQEKVTSERRALEEELGSLNKQIAIVKSNDARDIAKAVEDLTHEVESAKERLQDAEESARHLVTRNLELESQRVQLRQQLSTINEQYRAVYAQAHDLNGVGDLATVEAAIEELREEIRLTQERLMVARTVARFKKEMETREAANFQQARQELYKEYEMLSKDLARIKAEFEHEQSMRQARLDTAQTLTMAKNEVEAYIGEYTRALAKVREENTALSHEEARTRALLDHRRAELSTVEHALREAESGRLERLSASLRLAQTAADVWPATPIPSTTVDTLLDTSATIRAAVPLGAGDPVAVTPFQVLLAQPEWPKGRPVPVVDLPVPHQEIAAPATSTAHVIPAPQEGGSKDHQSSPPSSSPPRVQRVPDGPITLPPYTPQTPLYFRAPPIVTERTAEPFRWTPMPLVIPQTPKGPILTTATPDKRFSSTSLFF